MKKQYSVIILAAGKSSRMGMPKFLLKYDENTTFIEHIVKKYEAFNCEQIIIVLNKQGVSFFETSRVHFSKKIKIISNNYPERERFYSLKLGLKALSNNNHVFIHNVDNPLVNIQILSLLTNKIEHYDYIVPKHKKKGGHPILLSVKIIKNIIAEEKNNLNLKDYLSNYNKAFVEVDDENILLNINTEEEYNTFKNNNLYIHSK